MAKTKNKNYLVMFRTDNYEVEAKDIDEAFLKAWLQASEGEGLDTDCLGQVTSIVEIVDSVQHGATEGFIEKLEEAGIIG